MNISGTAAIVVIVLLVLIFLIVADVITWNGF